MDLKSKIILIAGPTASGKSEFAVKIAKKINGEIINADSMQVYKQLKILTARPTQKNQKRIKHHLYGFQNVAKKFSTGAWLKLAMQKIKEIRKKNKVPILVGGTGLYFKALIDGLVKIPEIPNTLRSSARILHKEIGQKNFYSLLIKLDPLSKKFVSMHDTQRTIRAYEVKKFTDRSLFDFIKETRSNFDKKIFIKLFINTPKQLLHKNVENRVDRMFVSGAIEEVKSFFKMKIKKDLSANKIIGINEINDYLRKKTTLARAKELIKLKTRQYAKRQFTWARGHMKTWEMIYSSDLNDLFRKAINKIS